MLHDYNTTNMCVIHIFFLLTSIKSPVSRSRNGKNKLTTRIKKTQSAMITYGGRPCQLTRNVKKHTISAPIPEAPTSAVLLLLSDAEAIPPSLYIHSTSINLKKTGPASFRVASIIKNGTHHRSTQEEEKLITMKNFIMKITRSWSECQSHSNQLFAILNLAAQKLQ